MYWSVNVYSKLKLHPFYRIIIIIISEPPSSVHMYFDKSILSLLESTTLECTTVGGGPTVAHNLTLWKNNELLATNQGDSLRYFIRPSQYGSYRCAVGDVYNTSLLYEKGI